MASSWTESVSVLAGPALAAVLLGASGPGAVFAVMAGAGLDVYEHEPHVHEGLFDLDNVVLLPHLGSATVETRTAMATAAARNVLAVLRGEPPISPIAAPG